MTSEVGALERAVARALGPVRSLRLIAGGDAHRAARVELVDGRSVFVKHGGRASAALMHAEAEGLAMLRARGTTLVVPEPLAVLEAPAALCLPWIEPGHDGPRAQEALGRGLAALHAPIAATPFGRASAHWLAGLPFSARTDVRWSSIYRALLTTLAGHVRDSGHDDGRCAHAIDRVATALDRLVDDALPSQVHGDLWRGNAMVDGAGRPVLIDPFAYVGDREVDWAMMDLFGGFTDRTRAAYVEVLPFAPGHRERRALYQLLPLAAHAALFGGHYVAQARSIADRYAG